MAIKKSPNLHVLTWNMSTHEIKNGTSQAILGCFSFLSSCIPLNGTKSLKELWIWQKSLHKWYHMYLINSMSLNVKEQHLKSLVIWIWNPKIQRCTCITGNSEHTENRTSGYSIYSFYETHWTIYEPKRTKSRGPWASIFHGTQSIFVYKIASNYIYNIIQVFNCFNYLTKPRHQMSFRENKIVNLMIKM